MKKSSQFSRLPTFSQRNHTEHGDYSRINSPNFHFEKAIPVKPNNNKPFTKDSNSPPKNISQFKKAEYSALLPDDHKNSNVKSYQKSHGKHRGIISPEHHSYLIIKSKSPTSRFHTSNFVSPETKHNDLTSSKNYDYQKELK